MPSWLSLLVTRLRDLWVRAKNEHASPREIGWSLGVGVWTACCPFVGFHMGIAFVAATALRLNRLWAMLGSRFSAAPILVTVAFSEIQLAHRIRTGNWAPVAWREILAHGRELFLDWILGTPLVATPLAVAAGMIGARLARRWHDRKVTPHKPDAARPRSSESRPSTPPAPTP